MRRRGSMTLSRILERFAVWSTVRAGSSWAFVTAALLVFVWLISGFFFGFTDTWQLVMNTISSIVTFLMVFLLQRSQNKESLAMQTKLNEIIAAQAGASNRLIDIEDLSEDEVRKLHERFQALAKRCRAEGDFTGPVSVETEVKPEPGDTAQGAALASRHQRRENNRCK